MTTSADAPSARSTPPRWIPTRATAARIAGWYGVIAAAWIYVSGWLLHSRVVDTAMAAQLETLKGWFFVGTTALILFVALDRVLPSYRGGGETAG